MCRQQPDVLHAGKSQDRRTAAWFGCALLCAQIVLAEAALQTHHRHHLEVLPGSAVVDSGCGYIGSKVILTALYGTTVRTRWLNCAIESAMMKQGNDSVIVLTDNVEEFTASWPSSLPCPARLVDVPSCLANTPLQHWLESPELASAVFRQQNIANAVRLAAIYKNGGTYIDLDIIPLQDKLFSAEGALSMQCTVDECGAEFWLNNAYLNFPPKHPFMWQLMNAFALEFNGMSSLPTPSAPRMFQDVYCVSFQMSSIHTVICWPDIPLHVLHAVASSSAWQWHKSGSGLLAAQG